MLHQAEEEAKRKEEEAKKQVHKIGYPAPETCLSALADNHNITSCVCVCVCVHVCVKVSLTLSHHSHLVSIRPPADCSRPGRVVAHVIVNFVTL